MKKDILGWTAVLLLATGGSALAMDMGGVQIHGFISQGFLVGNEYNYLSHKSTDGSFEFNEMGINFSKKLSEKLRVGVQFFARDLGDVANNKVALDWACGDYRWRDWLGIRAGKIKIPLGLYNETRDYDFLRTSIVMPQSIYDDLLRDTIIAISGAGLYGNVSIGSLGTVRYFGLTGALDPDIESGIGKWASARGTIDQADFNLSYDMVYTGSIKWHTPLLGLMIDVFFFKSGSNASLPATLPVVGPVLMNQNIDGFLRAVAIEYTRKNLLVAMEYLMNDTEGTTTISTAQGIPLTRTDINGTTEQYYLSASYQLTNWFELGAYYSVYFPDSDDKDGDSYVDRGEPDHHAWQKDIALSFRFDLTEGLILKIEGHKVDGTAQVFASDNPDRSEQDWYYGAAKLTFSF
ncbi:MAG: hypothetical protein HKP58_06215 [Desulfatitalea sp.]|nr:hypothetical protein [Desulfatitalea sp.]NNJ99991.1 hypothetical protein [Desulfatitalea sp.]